MKKKSKSKKRTPRLRRILLGHVGVDSGQLLVCDPCYIDSEWKKTKSLDVATMYIDVDNGSTWACVLHNPPKGVSTFPKFDAPLEVYGGKTPNDLIASGRWVTNDRPKSEGFSYQACCDRTLSPVSEKSGQLFYQKGHAGVGVAFSSGYGDGVYPVYGYVNKDDRVVKVEVLMS